MNTKPKTVTILNVSYAMASELDENYNLLERLVAEGKVGKVIWNGQNYYDEAAVKRLTSSMRTIPEGYVRVVEHATSIGGDARLASRVCGQTNALAKKIQVGTSKPAWFADKAWLEKQLGVSTPAKTPAKPAEKIASMDTHETLRSLQATIDKLRADVQGLLKTPRQSRQPRQMPLPVAFEPSMLPQSLTEDQLHQNGYRTLQELAKELDVSPSTVRGWYIRGNIRGAKLGARTFLHVEDTEKMYLKLDDNRAVVAARMGRRTNNNLGTSS